MIPAPILKCGNKAAAHCWHYERGWTDGTATTGKDSYVCCWCGVKRDRAWSQLEDPAHGAHARRTLRVYENGEIRKDT
jgi:hypothetical protein